jgi:hypothetical protein
LPLNVQSRSANPAAQPHSAAPKRAEAPEFLAAMDVIIERTRLKITNRLLNYDDKRAVTDSRSSQSRD